MLWPRPLRVVVAGLCCTCTHALKHVAPLHVHVLRCGSARAASQPAQSLQELGWAVLHPIFCCVGATLIALGGLSLHMLLLLHLGATCMYAYAPTWLTGCNGLPKGLHKRQKPWVALLYTFMQGKRRVRIRIIAYLAPLGRTNPWHVATEPSSSSSEAAAYACVWRTTPWASSAPALPALCCHAHGSCMHIAARTHTAVLLMMMRCSPRVA